MEKEHLTEAEKRRKAIREDIHARMKENHYDDETYEPKEDLQSIAAEKFIDDLFSHA